SHQGEKKFVFSGDLGQPGRPILRDPTMIGKADYLVVESTYGNRRHKKLSPSLDELVGVINDTFFQKKGNVIVPAFAVGRSQELIYYFYHLTRIGRLKNLTVFLDSPMAQSVTELTKRHLELFDNAAKKLAAWQAHGTPELTLEFTESVEESRALNTIRSGAVIISASGMCTAGRILHHLRHGLGHSQNTILITGYQAQGTLGRQLVDGASSVRIFGEKIPVRAEVSTIGGFSAHADKDAILNWLDGFRKAPKRTFITHGEADASSALAREITARFGWNLSIPKIGEDITIDEK
ncbi:MAG: MBL fold metallo-hydrolase, partial [Fimbriimonadaceae bacterium]|nr:MBL fold metallo-hydrolase [Alphaproteobacteria bacterium]